MVKWVKHGKMDKMGNFDQFKTNFTFTYRFYHFHLEDINAFDHFSQLFDHFVNSECELGGIPNLYRLVSAILECKSVTEKIQSMPGPPV